MQEDGLPLDESNPIIQTILNNATVQNALDNPRVAQGIVDVSSPAYDYLALKVLIEDPSSASEYMNDPEIRPVLVEVHNLMQNQ